MEPTALIRKPLVTEKSTFLSESNRYAFQVDLRATKSPMQGYTTEVGLVQAEILMTVGITYRAIGEYKRAIESLYGVRVLSVATQTRPGKLRRTRQGYVRTPTTKRAVVKVREGERIELF